MNFIFYLSLLTLFYINKQIFKNNNILLSETGDRHQKFASNEKVPLTGGIFLFLSFLFF